jgi:DNA-binding NtrC family response regulator
VAGALPEGYDMLRRVLLVDDDPAVLRSLAQGLSHLGVEPESAGSAEEALAKIAEYPPDLVLSDIRMPGLDGIELLELVRARAPSVDVVLMTAYDDMATVVRSMREGAFDFLVKPIDLDELENVLRRAFEDRRARERARRTAEEEAQAYRLDELVGREPRMIQVYKLVGQLAASRVPVLIRGESGTGKELVARAIHFNSAQASEPFLPVNCTAIPETLLESELFGHVRGAFTGAVADRRGRFALAGRGTIFLDEIGDTGPDFQAKVLRILEDGEFYPVGAERPERTEARVVAATHRDLEQLVEEGKFREDLYYRLKVVDIVLPPLRERPADLPLLAHHFVRKASGKLHRPEPALPDSTVEVLLQHDWPGNVRELENCVTRAITLATGGVIRPEHLGLAAPNESPGSFKTLEETERDEIRRVLAATGGNKTRTAEVLGISKPRLYRLIAKHKLA